MHFDAMELTRLLLPTLRTNAAEFQADSGDYGAGLVRECRKGLSAVDGTRPLAGQDKSKRDLTLSPTSPLP